VTKTLAEMSGEALGGINRAYVCSLALAAMTVFDFEITELIKALGLKRYFK